jgi:hypothetical protein
MVTRLFFGVLPLLRADKWDRLSRNRSISRAVAPGLLLAKVAVTFENPQASRARERASEMLRSCVTAVKKNGTSASILSPSFDGDGPLVVGA